MSSPGYKQSNTESFPGSASYSTMIYGTVTGHIKNITFSSAFEIESYEDVDMVHILNHNDVQRGLYF